MHGPIILTVAAAAFVTDAARSEPTGRIFVEADPAVVTITPLADDARLISLPTLRYALRVEPTCAAEMRPESIVVSIADTRKTYGANQIDGQQRVEIELILPDKQIGPLAIREFCRDGMTVTGTDRMLRINDVITAHLSLRCAGEGFESIVYASQSLDVQLNCELGDAEPEPSGDQDVSSIPLPR